MTNRLMMSVAAIALIAGTSLANAQATGGAAAQPSAPPAASGGAMQHGGEAAPGMKATQSEPTSPAAKTPRAAEGSMPGQKSKSMSSEADTKAPAKDMKAEGRENKMKAEGKNDEMKADGKSGNMKAEGKNDGMKADGKNDSMKAEGKNDNMKADGKNGNMNAETKGTERSQTTTGQAGAAAKLSTEQRTKITTVIREQRVAPVTNVNFSISVGTRIPRDVSYHTLPVEVVTIYPEWRGYDYILVHDQILVIDPRSHEIVAILDV